MERGGRIETNFKSTAYKEQAKESFKRRMHYNPRQSASKSRDKATTNATNISSITN